jgi:CRISPR type IV-associated protein Csf1
MLNPPFLSPTHLYWMASGSPETVGKGKKTLIPQSISFTCPLCGIQAYKGFTWKEVGMGNFTNWDWFSTDTPYLCVPCTSALKDDLLKKRDLIITQDRVIYLQKKDPADRTQLIEAIFHKKIEPPFVICITTSYQKHLLPRTSVNVTNKHVRVQFDEETIWVDPDRDLPIFEFVRELRENKAAVVQIEGVQFLTKKMKHRIPEERLRRMTQALMPFRGSSLLSLMSLLAKAD